MLTIRAVTVGVGVGLAVASLTYFNDAVVRQTYLIGNHLPVLVFGVVLLGAAVWNPLAGRFLRGLALSPGEWAVALAIALSACGWPGSGLYRTATGVLAMPSTLNATSSAWRSAGVMSYVPGGDPMLAPGHVGRLTRGEHGEPSLAAILSGQPTEPSPSGPVNGTAEQVPGPVASAVVEQLTSAERRLIWRLSGERAASNADRAAVAAAFNRLIAQPAWVLTLPGAALPAPAAESMALYDRLLEEKGLALERWLGTAGASADAAKLQSAHLDAESAYHLRLAARWALVEAFPGHVAPPPTGDGVLLSGGRVDPWAVDPLLSSRSAEDRFGIGDLPWQPWAPTLWRWGPLIAALGLASVCLAVIVHPQWSRRELLPYPLVRFVQEATKRSVEVVGKSEVGSGKSEVRGGKPGVADFRLPTSHFPLPHGSWVPQLMRHKLFWAGLVCVLGLHVVNGLHAWFEAIPGVSLRFDLNPLRVLLPGLSRAPQAHNVFNAAVYLSVVAFAFFLTPKVSFSVGFATFAWVMLGAVLASQGVTFTDPYLLAGEGTLLRVGAYAAFALVIVYTGRRYYLAVVRGAVTDWGGEKVETRNAERGTDAGGAVKVLADPLEEREVPRSAVWAARWLAMLMVVSVWWLHRAGLSVGVSAAVVGMALGMWVVLARIVAETGVFYVASGWLPVGVLVSLFGFEAIGPTGFIVLGLASVLLVGDPREALLPFVSTGLAAAERVGQTPPRRLGVWLGLMALGSLALAGVATLWFQMNLGINHADPWAKQWLPQMPFNELSRQAQELSAAGTLVPSVWAAGSERFSLVTLDGSMWAWLGLGGALALGASLARLRLPWWPIHPVLFLLWGTESTGRFAWSFMLGWLIKVVVVKLAGAKGYHAGKPLMVGIIAGELLGALLWTAVGTAYYMSTGMTPRSYLVFPG